MDPSSLFALPPGEAQLFLPVLLIGVGLDLYATLIVLSLAGGFPWLAAPPAGLSDLASGWVLAPAAILYLGELLAELHPGSGLFWHTAQSLIRPLAGGFLCLLLLQDAGLLLQVAGAIAFGGGAWVVHAAAWGLDLDRTVRDRKGPARALTSLVLDAGVVGLLILALDLPMPGAAASAGVGVLAAALAVRFAPLARFGVHLAWDRTWSLLGRSGWRGREAWPRWLRAETPPAADLSSGRLKGCPAAALDFRGRGSLDTGWLTTGGRGVSLTCRRFTADRPFSVRLVHADPVERGGLFDRIPVRIEGEGRAEARPRIVLSKRGPDPRTIRGEILEARPAS